MSFNPHVSITLFFYNALHTHDLLFNQWIVFMQTYSRNRLGKWQIMDDEEGVAQHD